MPDVPTPAPPPQSGQRPVPSAPQPNAGHTPITEEMDSAKWTLPPIMPVLMAAVAIAIVVALVSFTLRPKPVADATITKIATADQAASTMVAVHATPDTRSEK